jgi:dipeptidyl aminopeptidase/acylaminoacyl peptidase
MQPRDLALLRVPSDPSLTPDGRLAAVAVTRIDLDADAYRSQIWVVPTDGSAPPRRFTTGDHDSRPRWSPDGRWLAFVRAPEGGKPQLHVMPSDGGESRRLTEHPLGAADPVWSPDSTRIAYVARIPEPGRYGTDPEGGKYVDAAKEPPRRITTLQFRLDGVGFTFDRRPHVFVIDALTDGAEPVQITRGDFDHGGPVWSPDGRSVAFVSARHDGRDGDENADIFIAPADGGDARQVTRSDLTVARPAFSPDGERLYFVSGGPGTTEFAGRNSGIWTVPADGSEPPRRLTEAEAWDVDPLFSGGSALTLLTDEPGAVTTVALNRGAADLVRFPTDGGEPSRLLSAGRRQVTGYARAGGTTVAIITSGVSSGELVALDSGGAGGGAPAERVLTDFGGEMARKVALRPMIELRATAPDGAEVHGWVLKPAGKGPFPVLLNIHGGPFSQYGYVLFDEAQVYAGAGYAVVMGNPRGSASYGEAHGRAIVGDMGNLDRKDILALLDAALEDPELDSDRVGVMGGSYGGFMTTWLAAHDGDRFRAAISERAVNAFDSFTGSSDIGWIFTDAYLGTDPARQLAQSPLTHAHKIDIPMLLIHSEEDWRCPVEQAQRLFVLLKRKGVETELLLFPGEGHELSRSGLPSHRVARFEAILAWWERHLKPAGDAGG